jgi:hypothetical protein
LLITRDEWAVLRLTCPIVPGPGMRILPPISTVISPFGTLALLAASGRAASAQNSLGNRSPLDFR